MPARRSSLLAPYVRGPEQRHVRHSGTSSTDVEYLIPPHHYIIELKRAIKYEPLSTEVLHHAEWVRRYGGGSDERLFRWSSPRSIAGYDLRSPPCRSAPTASAGCARDRSSEGDDENMVWFDEPLAAWAPAERPAFLHDHPASARLRWHHVPSVVGQYKQQVPDRPVMVEVPYVMVSRKPTVVTSCYGKRSVTTRRASATTKPVSCSRGPAARPARLRVNRHGSMAFADAQPGSTRQAAITSSPLVTTLRCRPR